MGRIFPFGVFLSGFGTRMTRMGRMFADFLLICGFRVFIDVDVLTDISRIVGFRVLLMWMS
jgi:hypothetical protein